MLDYFPRLLRRFVVANLDVRRDRFKGVGTKKIKILVIISLVVTARLFFSVFLDEKALAKQTEKNQELNLTEFNPMTKIRTEKDINDEKICASVLDEKKPDDIQENLEKNEAVKKEKKEQKTADNSQDRKIKEILSGYPMEKMVSAIGQKDKETAAFLVAIAKKESDWGMHAPQKGGQDCYNYWGYKGGYNSVQGYSCFDSPEQAVEVVGGRIDQLTEKGLNTPERMVVWKCGSSCSWDNPKNVQSWIGAVRTYWSKLVS